VRRLSWAQQLTRTHTALTPALVLTLCSPYACVPSLPPEELGGLLCPPLSVPPACSASERSTGVMRSPVAADSCPVSVHWMFSSHFLPLLKLLERSGAAGTSSQTHAGKAGRSCRTRLLPARAMPPSPGSRGQSWCQRSPFRLLRTGR